MAEAEAAKPAAGAGAIRIETVPDALVERLKKSPFKRPLPRRKSFLERCNPELAEVILRTDAVSNSLVDLQEDILRQFEEKGCAQIGAEIMDCGRTRLVRLPHAF
jgi:hypothetical protein